MTRNGSRPVGELLREWRERRRLSQMELALQAEISTRHLSFVETSRSKPSREMVLHLAEQLELPLREQNQLLLAAGYAPAYGERDFDSPELAVVREAARQVLRAHEPNPAIAVDRLWNLVDANSGAMRLMAGVDPALLAPPANVLRAALHPKGLASRITNLPEWRAHLLGRLKRQVTTTADPDLASLYDEISAYPAGGPAVAHSGPEAAVAPLRLMTDGRELRFFTTVSVIGTPMDVTVSELAIESFFPADEATAAFLRA